MTIKQLLKNIKFKNFIYIVVAKYKKFIRRQYNKLYSKDNIDDMLFKTASCPDCYFNGSCLNCGCNFKELITTDKPCPNGKF